MKPIDTQTVSVAVAQDKTSEKLIAALQRTGKGSPRALQTYCFSVHPHELDDLLRQHAANDFGSGIYCLTNPKYYNSETGVVFEGEDCFCE